MRKRVVLVLAIFLVAATSAQAQWGGGGGGRGHGGAGPPTSGDSSSPAPTPVPPPKPPKPENEIEIVGVVTAVDPAARRVTIAYEAVDQLNWPHGVMPFSVYKSDLLKTVSVGERVRFRLDDQQVVELRPY